MNKTHATSALRNALATLYPARADAERVVADAGLPAASIAFSEKAVNNWHAILNEAAKHNQVPRIIEIVRNEYPEDASLRQASQAYLAATGQSASRSANRQSGASLAAGSDRGQTDEERRPLEELLARHQRNLQHLQTRKAVYALGEEPLSLVNQIEHEEAEIARIQAELRRL